MVWRKQGRKAVSFVEAGEGLKVHSCSIRADWKSQRGFCDPQVRVEGNIRREVN